MKRAAVEDLSRWTVGRATTTGMRPVELEEVARLIGDSRDPLDPGGPTASPEVDWEYLGRWPIEVRLGVLRVLTDLGIVDTLKKHDPETHDALVERLRGGGRRVR